MRKNKDTKYRAKLAIFYLIIYAAVLSYFYYINYIDFEAVRTTHMVILGVSMLAIILNYVFLGQVFLIASLFGLTAEYILYIKHGASAAASGELINTAVLTLGFVVGFVMEMYIYKRQ